ncbi:MAG: hypothetical protein K9W44_14100 [Candidatus Lokiarchaeota archaeon]|nr:hypothetical protein [Candidatus Harpocratesius repetitus]
MLNFLNIYAVQADWTPGVHEIAPSKDTYLSLSGALAEPNNNFGGAESLDVGDGFKGICMSLITFDLSSIPDDANSLMYSSSCVAYGDATWTVHVSVIIGAKWEELQISTVNNDINAISIYSGNTGNLTDIIITGSTDEISLNLSNYLSESEITLVFSPDIAVDGTWITIQAKENQYLSSFSNPPHLKYDIPEISSDTGSSDDTIPSSTDDSSDNSSENSSGSSIVGGLIFIGIVITVIVILKKKKKAANV